MKKKTDNNQSNCEHKKVARNTKKIRAQLTRKKLDSKQADNMPTMSGIQFKSFAEKMNANFTRREFMKAGAMAAGAVTLPGLLAACHSDSNNSEPESKTELRTFVFDFSWEDTENHDLVLVAGSNYHTLNRTTPEKLIELRAKHPISERIPDERNPSHRTRDAF